MKKVPWLRLFALFGVALFLAATLQIHRSRDMSALREGQRKFREAGEMFRPINDLLEMTVRQRDGLLTLSEAEVNAWIDDKIVGRQGGLMGSFVSFERVWLDFHAHEDGLGRVEVVFERKEFGRTVTQGATFRIRRNNREILITCDGISLGRMNLPQEAYYLVARPLEAFVSLFARERDQLLKFNTIHFVDDQILLEPRFRRAPEPGPEPVFVSAPS